ncbi:ArsR family transcriptional regulator, partial [Candidatus Thorarchaeota archaeon]
MSELTEKQMLELAINSSEDLSNIVKAIAHKKRIEILGFLANADQDFSRILRTTKIGKTALANHISILIKHGLIERLERGTYSITSDGSMFLRVIITSFVESRYHLEKEREQLLERYVRREVSGEKQINDIKRLRYKPRWVTHLGCVEGCLKYLKKKISTGWLYGGTGHGFVLNIARDLCPSGPTAWRTTMLYELASNLGYRVDGIFAQKSSPDFLKLQEEAWSHVRKCIDDNIPCYGWELSVPEYYIIYGYDDIGYYYSGPGIEDGTGPKPWKEIGNSHIGILEMYSVHIEASEDHQKAIKDAFTKVLYHATNPDDIIFPNYRSGIQGYDWWIAAIKDGSAIAMGHSYNTAVWTECRKYAVEFLKEARKHVSSDVKHLINEAKESYDIVYKSLERIQKDYPFSVS